MRDPRERLRDILEAIAAIERYAARGAETFRRDELVQVWILHHLLIIGEAAARLGREFHDSHREVPWARIVAMRNILLWRRSGRGLEHRGGRFAGVQAGAGKSHADVERG